jgi:glycyl-tRNA synthetase
MIDIWRKHFVLAESMLEMECTNLTPAVVLATSGHVDRFTDLMVRDPETGECFRADKLLEEVIDALLEENPTMPTDEREQHLRIQRQADAFSPTELDELLVKYGCKAPSGQAYSPSFPFNLMFKTSIGPEGTAVGYLRPETAQGLFVNFRRLLDLNAQKMPFAAAQVGYGFRNEIAPRSGLLRVREFCMAEIEHFVDPGDKSHPNFASVANKQLVLFGRDDQLGTGKTKFVTVGDAVKEGLINNETLAYFMARTQLYMERIGMDPERLRFRQHLSTEMAHYASDCWDLEIKSSYGWVECVGHADRACYDLQVHSKATNTSMLATKMVNPPVEVEIAKLKFDRKLLGQVFKQDQRVVSGALEALAEKWEDFEPIASALESDGKTMFDGFEVTKEMVTWTKSTKKVFEVKYTPSVIEPSFGIGRILYSLLEHSFYQRDGDEQRCVMRFKPAVAPDKCAVLPISANDECCTVVDAIAADLMESDLSTRVDKSSAALGRRYARADELGCPFAVTVDFETLKDRTVTLRERDSMKQVRMPQDEVTPVIWKLVHGKLVWEDLIKLYPVVQVDDGEEGGTPVAAESATVVEATSRGRFSRPAPAK